MVYARDVTCPRCAAQIRPGQKFCPNCGLALASACPNCATPFEPGQKFCAECGTALPADDATIAKTTARQGSPSAAVAERRFVSVLFADLVGFTQLVEPQDPEAVRELLSTYFDVARRIIDGYGGTVEKFIGDAVMAVWGAPIAREDDPERAVRAALDLVAQVRQIRFGDTPLALRAAVLTGEAAVVPDRAGEGIVAGDVVNTASRLQSVAQPGFVLVGESTYQATSRAIAYEPAGEQMLKGKSAPVPAWRALRVVARRGGEARDEALEPPFVGRDEELRLLADQLAAVEREGRLRMVSVTGQAGIGKSRLMWELEKYLDGLAGQTYYWNQGRSPAYGEGISFWALGEMVRRRARIAEGDDQASTRTKLRESLAVFVPDEDERRWLEPALGALLGIDQANWSAREQLFSAWRTYFERVAQNGPTVLVFEDLQWADSGLLDFIEHMLEWTRDKPILIVALSRPELLERRPNFGMGHRAFAAIHLEPLSDEAMRDLVRGLVKNVPDQDLAKIVERAEGVPLYAVETVRSLLDAGYCVRNGDTCDLVGSLPALDVPPTLRALISSRLDALDAHDRKLLQAAAVIGQVFATAAVASLTNLNADEVEQRLHELGRKELVHVETDPRSPEHGQYGFTQGFVREVAYSTLSKRDRRTLHLAAARYFDTIGDEELAGVVATHYVEAFKAAPEGEEGAAVAAQARVALRAAAERARQLHSNMQAVSYYELAMSVAANDEELNDLRVEAARVAGGALRHDIAEPLMRAAIAWSEQQSDQERTLEWMGLLAGGLLETSRIDEAMDLMNRAIEKGPSDDGRAQIYLYGHLARGHLFRGEGALALTAVEKALAAAERIHHWAPTLNLLITKSWALSTVGRVRESEALLVGAMELADQEGDLGAQLRSRFNYSGTALVLDDPRRSLEVALDGVGLLEKYGLPIGNMATNAAGAALIIGDLDEVLRLEAATSEALTTIGSLVFGWAACAVAMRGDSEGARVRLSRVEQEVAKSSSPQDQSELLHVQALVAFAEGRVAESIALARDAMTVYHSIGTIIAGILAGHAALFMRDVVAAREELKSLAALPPGPVWLERSRRTLAAGVLALDGQTLEAASEYRSLIDEWRSDEMIRDLAMCALERAVLLSEEVGAQEAREDAREAFARMGAEILMERLEAAARVDGSTGARSSTTGAARREAAAQTRR